MHLSQVPADVLVGTASFLPSWDQAIFLYMLDTQRPLRTSTTLDLLRAQVFETVSLNHVYSLELPIYVHYGKLTRRINLGQYTARLLRVFPNAEDIQVRNPCIYAPNPLVVKRLAIEYNGLHSKEIYSTMTNLVHLTLSNIIFNTWSITLLPCRLETLVLVKCEVHVYDSSADCLFPETLKSLTLYKCSIYEFAKLQLWALPNLEHLHIHGTHFDLQPHYLCKSIVHLELTGMETLTSIGISCIIQALPLLEILNVSGASIILGFHFLIIELRKHPLKKLIIDDCPINQTFVTALIGIGSCIDRLSFKNCLMMLYPELEARWPQL